jgi:hypothetical protein
MMKYIGNDYEGCEPYTDELEYGLGSLYPMPGGLRENVEHFLGKEQVVHLALKYSVYHNTGSREVSHVLFLQIVRMCNTHPFSSTVLSPHPAFLLSYSVHRSSGKKFLPCLRQSLTLSVSWYSCFLPDL